MIKKLAGAAVGSVLIASILAGSICVAGAVTGKTGSLADPLGEAGTQTTAAAEATPAAADPYAAYLFVHFVGNESTADQEQIYFSISEDGTNWQTLNNNKPILKSTLGEQGVRDPHIIRGQNGDFYIVATDLSIYHRGGWTAPQNPQTTGSQNIIVWKGTSLTDWSEASAIDVGSSYHALDVWAPETIWDNVQNKYMVFWASIVGDKATGSTDWIYRIYRSYTTDFEHFTEPEVYIERKDSTIDTTFYYDEANGTYYRFSKTEGNPYNWVYMEKGNSIDGDFEMVSTYRVDGKAYYEMGGYEGPTLYQLNGQDKVCLLLDHYGASAGYAPYETDDLAGGVFTPGTAFNFNGVKFRHGSVIPITQAEYDQLNEAYGTGDKTKGSLIYELGFDNENPTAVTGSYTATANGTITYTEGLNGGKAAVINGSGNYISVDGAVLAGKENLTVSFVVKQNNADNNSWIFYAASNNNEQNYTNEKYIGALFKDKGTIACERYLRGRNNNEPDSYQVGVPSNEWLYITIVYGKATTKVFINGQLKNDSSNRATTATTASLLDVLGQTPTVYLGRANWSANSEYSNMTLDSFRVYDYAMPDAEAARLYTTDTASRG